jgi:chromosome segregation ATPase
MSVKREKYEKAKNQSKALQSMLEKAEVNKTENLFEIVKLQQDIEEQYQENKSLQEKITKLQSEVERWKSLSERLPDDQDIEDLKKANGNQTKIIESLEKQITKLENGKDMLLFQIKTLEESRNDLKSQLIELKQENRELKRLEPILTK